MHLDQKMASQLMYVVSQLIIMASQLITISVVFYLVEEADIEDDAGNVIKEVYVQPVVPLEFHVGYRLGSEDPEIFSDGGKDDRDGWVCPRMWPQVPIPVHGSAPRTSRTPTSLAAEAPCGSAHSQLKKDLLQQHHNLVNLLAALNVDVCKEYRQHNAPAVLSRVREGNKHVLFVKRYVAAHKL